MGLSHSPRIITDGLVLCVDAANKRSYPGTGTVWTDLAGGNAGTLTNMETDGTDFSSVNGGSLIFDGSDEYVVVPDSPKLSFSTAMSLCGWVYSDGTSAVQTLCSKGGDDSDPSAREWRIGLHNNGDSYSQNYIQVLIGRSTGAWGKVWYPAITLPFTTWIYICMCWDEPLNAAILYKDGIQVASTNYDGTIKNGTANVFLAASHDSSNDPERNLDGKISHVQLYNRALTADEILQNYTATRGRFA